LFFCTILTHSLLLLLHLLLRWDDLPPAAKSGIKSSGFVGLAYFGLRTACKVWAVIHYSFIRNRVDSALERCHIFKACLEEKNKGKITQAVMSISPR
jgi:hypothetical protein